MKKDKIQYILNNWDLMIEPKRDSSIISIFETDQLKIELKLPDQRKGNLLLVDKIRQIINSGEFGDPKKRFKGKTSD